MPADASLPADAARAAGAFSAWLADALRVHDQGADADVPCDGCTACCRSGQFVVVAPEETRTLEAIPDELLFPAPLAPPGHRLLGHDADGRCPLLVGDRCSTYEVRPRTCRSYDCRVFAAAGVAPDPSQPDVAARVAEWRFEHPEDADLVLHDAVRATAAVLRSPELADVVPSTHPTQIAVGAVLFHRALLDRDDDGARVGAGGAPSQQRSADAVRVAIRARREDRGR